MKKKRLIGMIIIGVLEILIGLIGCLYLVWMLINICNLGFGWMVLPVIVMWALILPLGRAMLQQNKSAWNIHMILLPLITGTILFTWLFMGADGRIITSIPLILCIIALYYITRPKVKEQFGQTVIKEQFGQIVINEKSIELNPNNPLICHHCNLDYDRTFNVCLKCGKSLVQK